jgi:hypothetical protein
MPYQVDDATLHAMSGSELSRVRTELRLLPREPIKQVCSRRGGPALLCNQVESLRSLLVSQLFSYGRQVAKDHS